MSTLDQAVFAFCASLAAVALLGLALALWAVASGLRDIARAIRDTGRRD